MTVKAKREKLRHHLRTAVSFQTLNFNEVKELSRIVSGYDDWQLYDDIFLAINELVFSEPEEENSFESVVEYLLHIRQSRVL